MSVYLEALRKYAEGFRRGYPPGVSVVAIDPDELLALIEAVEAAREWVLYPGPCDYEEIERLVAALAPFEAQT